MTVHDLAVVPHSATPAERAQILMKEARASASQHVELLIQALIVVGKFSKQIAEGGDVYPIGIRDLSRKLAEDAIWCAHTCSQIKKNTGGAPLGDQQRVIDEEQWVDTLNKDMEGAPGLGPTPRAAAMD